MRSQRLPYVRQMLELPAGMRLPCGLPGKIARYQYGLLVQTTGRLEDELDGETMMETEALHKEHFYAFERILRAEYPDMLAIGAGCCTKCKTCTYPDEPCRFPKEAFSSMEAYGMVVTQICQDNGLSYYYGPCTITYTSCYCCWGDPGTGR